MSPDSEHESPAPPAGEIPGLASSEPVASSGNEQDRCRAETAPASQDTGPTDACAALQKTCEGMLMALEKMRASLAATEQRQFDKANPNHNIRKLAQQLWTECREAPDNDRAFGLPPDSKVGKEFLRGFYPTKANAIRMALMAFRRLAVSEENHRSNRYFPSIELTNSVLDKKSGFWTDGWQPVDSVSIYRICPGPSVDDPFHYDVIDRNIVEQIDEYKPEFCCKLPHTCFPSWVSGLIVQVSVKYLEAIVDFQALKTIFCLTEAGKVRTDRRSKFLDGHAAEWRDTTMLNQSGLRNNSGNLAGSFSYGLDVARFCQVVRHHMRSFSTVGGDAVDWAKPDANAGLQCHREMLEIPRADGKGILRLREKRYSTALTIQPHQRPCGKFTLVSAADRLGYQDPWINALAGIPIGPDRALPWTIYGILPAGLFTGISAYQIQICAFIDVWEEDWTRTIGSIDAVVSVKFEDMRNEDKLRGLLMETRQETSLRHFKVIKILGIFLDIVRGAPKHIESHCRIKSRKILSYNWDIVRQRQQDAAERITVKLQRTKDEVQGLLDGQFQVQSIDEAQKSRMLNKYLFIFTFFTILFLPPTFVATLFGNSLFNSPSGGGDDSTPGSDDKAAPDAGIRKKFWVTLAAISVATYVAAGLMMLGTASDMWKPLAQRTKAEAGLLKGKMQRKGKERYERSWKKFWRKEGKKKGTAAGAETAAGAGGNLV